MQTMHAIFKREVPPARLARQTGGKRRDTLKMIGDPIPLKRVRQHPSAADAQSKILMLEGISNAQVDLVWDPAWNQEMISEEGKMKLGMI